MSQRGMEGKRIWRERQGVFGPEIGDQIIAESTQRMLAWTASGRVPWWIRVKARLRGQRIDVRPGVKPGERYRR